MLNRESRIALLSDEVRFLTTMVDRYRVRSEELYNQGDKAGELGAQFAKNLGEARKALFDVIMLDG